MTYEHFITTLLAIAAGICMLIASRGAKDEMQQDLFGTPAPRYYLTTDMINYAVEVEASDWLELMERWDAIGFYSYLAGGRHYRQAPAGKAVITADEFAKLK